MEQAALIRLIAAISMTTVLAAMPPDEIEKRIDALIARMTLEEKLGQMSQSTSMQTPLSEEIRRQIRAGRWGSFLNAGSPADRAEAQRIAVKESRLGIPLIFGRDVIHGYRTIFPIPLGLAATWDADLAERASAAAAKEAAAEGIHWTFAPMIDIARDPRWGRVAESLGEDPCLTGTMGAAMVRGFQTALASCAKHYVGYGAAEAGRDYNSTFIPERQLREVYLPPFRAAVDAGVDTVMTAFNALNGVPATGNEFTIRRILRGEWKFAGVVVSDYESVVEMVKHGTARDAADAAEQAVRAGVDMEMVSTAYYAHLKRAVEERRVPVTVIDGAVRHILRLKFRLGLFERPLRSAITVEPGSATRTLAQEAAEESFVLLKNDGVLPLNAGRVKVAVIGPLADSPVDQMGTWAMDARPQDAVTPLAALRSRFGAERVTYAPGLRNSRDTAHDGFPAALDAARACDVVLLFLGEEQILSGEAHSRAFLNLPGAQEQLAAEVARAGKPLVTILFAGRPLTFAAVAAKSSAVLWGWHPGTMGGPAAAALLDGARAPSGKLPITFPRTVGQVPIYYAHLNTGRPASTGELGIPTGNPVDPAGYTSKYLDVDFTPEYPFGYGLSYTTFAYSPARVSAPAMQRGGAIEVSAEIANTGEREGSEIVQLYVRDVVASVARPVRELKNFRRIQLQPGQKQTVAFPLSERDLAFYDKAMRLTAEPGEFEVWIAPDAVSGVPARFTLVH